MPDKNIKAVRADDDVNTPYARKASALKGIPDQLKPNLADAEDRQEALVDEAVEESMDASDPPSPKQIT